MGLNYTLNHCLKYNTGQYIARMDGDDISLPHRFAKQVEFLDKNKDIAVVSSSMIHFDSNGDWGLDRIIKYPNKNDLLAGNPFAHGASMMRREVLEKVNGYTVDNRLLRVEDYHLWLKIFGEGYRGYNFEEPLYKMLDDYNAYKRRTFKNRLNEIYVRYLVIKELKITLWKLPYILRPLLVYFMPQKLYQYLRRKKLRYS